MGRFLRHSVIAQNSATDVNFMAPFVGAYFLWSRYFVQQIRGESVCCTGGTNENVLQLYSRQMVSSCKHICWSSYQDTGIRRIR